MKSFNYGNEESVSNWKATLTKLDSDDMSDTGISVNDGYVYMYSMGDYYHLYKICDIDLGTPTDRKLYSMDAIIGIATDSNLYASGRFGVGIGCTPSDGYTYFVGWYGSHSQGQGNWDVVDTVGYMRIKHNDQEQPGSIPGLSSSAYASIGNNNFLNGAVLKVKLTIIKTGSQYKMSFKIDVDGTNKISFDVPPSYTKSEFLTAPFVYIYRNEFNSASGCMLLKLYEVRCK